MTTQARIIKRVQAQLRADLAERIYNISEPNKLLIIEDEAQSVPKTIFEGIELPEAAQ